MTVGRATLLAALAIGLGVTGCGGKASPKPSTAHRSSATPRSPDQSAEVEFGYIESLTPLAKGYKLRFDLHLYLSGMTGLRACVDNHDCPPGTTSLLDDVYDHDLKFVLTYYVPPDARVAMLGQGASHIIDVSITAAELYRLAQGQRLHGLKLIDPRLADTGFFVTVVPHVGPPVQFDSAVRLEQVYHP